MVNPYQPPGQSDDEIVRAELAGQKPHSAWPWIVLCLVLYALCGAFGFAMSYTGRW